MDKYPVYKKEILKKDIKFNSVDEFIEALKMKIEADEIAAYIWVFDNFNHTKNIWWEIQDWIIAGKILLFCFWQALLLPEAMAVRPRNIAIAEYADKFIVSFLEAPVDKVNDKKIFWIIEHIEK